jgi:hypothetical protein
MASTPLQPLVFNRSLTTEWINIYTVVSPANYVGIDAAVFNNYSTQSQTFSIRLVQTGSASELNEVITSQNVRAESNNLAPAMIGQALVTGGVIQAKASANDSINVNITGTVVQ